MSAVQKLTNLNKLNGRQVGHTENSWCLAVPGGTGIAVLAIAVSKQPETSEFQETLNKLQTTHPILRSRIHTIPNTNSFSLITAPTPFVQVKNYNLTPNSDILKDQTDMNMSPLQLVLEHELNENPWPTTKLEKADLLFASIYALPDVKKWIMVLRLHVSACDKTTAVSILRELMIFVAEKYGKVPKREIVKKEEIDLGIEDLIPHGMGKKGWFTRGVDMLGYSVNSLRLTNLKFKDTKSARCSQVARTKFTEAQTEKILNACKSRSIKLSSALTAAGLIATHGSSPSKQKRSYTTPLTSQHKKYGVVTLTDCRTLLNPPLSPNTLGFYHSAVLNTHVVKGGENLWDLAQKVHTTFSSYKNCNRHFTDMADLNFLMCRAVENPALTSSSSLRTSIMSVFEDTVVEKSDPVQDEIGLEDYIGCASIHGIGPSIAVFDTIRDGKLDCVFVYPAPLHSRSQIEELIDNMKTLLVETEDQA
ncbi:hypothetical protein ACFE04_000605 [Oxalis oulophora]